LLTEVSWAAPGEEVVQTFDPRGDWSTSRHGVSRGVPGMEEPPEGGGKSKKKKKKPKAAGDGEDEDDEGRAEGTGDAATQDPPEKKLESRDNVSKRIKAVTKKLTQARDLAAAANDGSKELNVDQKLKIESIPTMEAELAELNALLASLAV